VALTMLDDGDWVDPMRNEDTGHWTKPPLTYWAIASSITVFGSNEWAARLPMALAYLACIGLCWGSAKRIAPGREALAGARLHDHADAFRRRAAGDDGFRAIGLPGPGRVRLHPRAIPR
jgi:hypothetical protein